MELTFLSHNYYSLYLSYIYTRNIKASIPHAKINLILNGSLAVPQGILDKTWDSVCIHESIRFTGKPLLEKMKALVRFYRHIRGYFIKKMKFNRCQVLFVFKDTGLVNKELIRHFHDKLHAKVVLIEEGYAIYSDLPRENIHKRIVKAIAKGLQALMLLPKPYHNLQGMNERIDAMIVKRVESLPEKKKRHKLVASQSRSLFNPADAEAYLKEMHSITSIKKTANWSDIQILYIGQPISDQGLVDEKTEQAVLLDVFQHLSGYSVAIKRHHLEHPNKYRQLAKTCKNVSILDDRFTLAPVEALYALSWAPIIITPWSSASINIRSINPNVFTIYLYPLFHHALAASVVQLMKLYDGDRYLTIQEPEAIEPILSSLTKMEKRISPVPEPRLYEEMKEILRTMTGFPRTSEGGQR